MNGSKVEGLRVRELRKNNRFHCFRAIARGGLGTAMFICCELRMGWTSLPREETPDCIQAYGREFTVFPYPLEVEQLIKELIAFRASLHASELLHPLLIAAHFGATFKHIHPFDDGNGQLGRFLIPDYLLRQGYLPIVFKLW